MSRSDEVSACCCGGGGSGGGGGRGRWSGLVCLVVVGDVSKKRNPEKSATLLVQRVAVRNPTHQTSSSKQQQAAAAAITTTTKTKKQKQKNERGEFESGSGEAASRGQIEFLKSSFREIVKELAKGNVYD